MSPVPPTIEFFEGVPETLSDVSLRRNRMTGARFVVMIFEELQSLERFNSFRKRFNNSLRLLDEEGEIQIEPDSVQFVFGGGEGDELRKVECKFEITQDDHWERFMRFMNRYAEANGMEYQDRKS